jgi:hypothetical protein
MILKIILNKHKDKFFLTRALFWSNSLTFSALNFIILILNKEKYFTKKS